MDLQTLWFVLIAVLWAGYFLLEGFDFGVGMLLPFVPRDDEERSARCCGRSARSGTGTRSGSSSPAAATFAAFPAWYATMFSGFYLALLLVLFFLIVRVVSFEWRSKSETPGWRAIWTWATRSELSGRADLGRRPLNLVYGVPIDSNGDSQGLLGPLQPIHGTAGVAAVLLFAFHGATFLSLRTLATSSARTEPAPRARYPGCDPGGVTSPGRSSSRWTRTRRICSRPRCRHSRIAALVLAVGSPTRTSGRAFALTAGRGRARRDAVHGPLSPRHGLEPGVL